jgi:hypothetical protein
MQLVLPSTSCFGKEEEGKWPFKAYIQMLVKNNVSASKLVTKMQFDNNPMRNRVLFSPVMAVAEEHREILKQQADSHAAQSAIKLSVYQPPEAVREAVKFEVFDDTKDGAKTLVDKWKKS